MKKTLLAIMMALAMLTAYAEGNHKPFTIPELTSWTGGTGTTTLSGRIVVRSKQFRPIAEQLAADYALMCGRRLSIVTGKPSKGDIVLTCKKLDTMPSEGYQLEIGEAIAINSPGTQGAFWGTQTLLQLLEQGPLPRGVAMDVPQYRLRGFMLDVGRKFIPIGYLRNLVRVMAYYKMNTLQLHLNDNGFKQYFQNDWSKTSSAFRLECDTYPGLTAKDGHYTKQEFIELQRLAERLHVEIIPEIDAPAHVLAFTQYRPELGSEEYGMDHFNLSNPAVYTFMDSLFREYLSGKEPVFRGPRVNIGTDEYSNRDQQVVEQFRAFTDHYLALMQQYGKQPLLWGSLTHARGTTPIRHEGVLMACWSTDYAQPDSMATLGYQLISIPDGLVYIVPAAGYYYDYLNCEYLYQHWTPAVMGNKTFPEQHPQVEGGMFAVWNDHYGNGIATKDIHHRLFPAMQTVATKCWTGQKTTLPYAEYDRMRTLLSEAPGVNELGRLSAGAQTLPAVEPGKALGLGIDDVGFDYAVSFDIDCQPEPQGTILTQSPYATFYLSSRQSGRLAFERDGYINEFNYALPSSGRVNIRIEGTNKETRLFVNGRRRQVLSTQPVYVIAEDNRVDHLASDAPFHPTVYSTGRRMFYVPTLFFPLHRAGNFKSHVTNLRVEALK